MGNGCVSQKSSAIEQNGIGQNSDILNYKIVLIGNRGAGKSSILLRYAQNQFQAEYNSTTKPIMKNITKKVNVPRNMLVSLTIWDLPGHEDMDLRETYFRNVDAVIVVVDLSDSLSLELAGSWRQDFLKKSTRTETKVNETGLEIRRSKEYDPRAVPVILLGNKYDLIEEKLTKRQQSDPLPTHSDPIDDGDGSEISSSHNKELSVKQETDDQGPQVEAFRSDEVKLMEKLEKNHGYVASIAVSAKDKHGSVDAAMQAVVRFLIDKSTVGFLKLRKKLISKESSDNAIH